MRRIAQVLAATAALACTGLTALPATASPAGLSAASRPGTALAGQSARPAGSLTPAQQQALSRTERISALRTGNGVITGVVLGRGGTPLANVCVRARGSLATRTAFTGPDGQYVIGGLPRGSYRVEYRGCSPAGRVTAQWYGGLTAGTASEVQVTGTMPIELAPVTLGTISARFDRPAVPPRPPVPAPGQAAASGSQQTVTLFGMLRERVVTAPRSTDPSARLLRSGHISGVVRDSAGHPLAGVCVLTDALHGSGFFGLTRTSRAGGYTLRTWPGSYYVDFLPGCFGATGGSYAPQLWKAAGSTATATVVRVKSGQVIRHIGARLGPGAVIAGKLVPSTSPHPSLAGMCAIAIGTAGQRLFFDVARAKSDGTFRLPALATGKYRLRFIGCRINSPWLDTSVSKLVAVTDGQTTAGIRVPVRLGGSIAGVVKNTTGSPLRGICVVADSSHGESATVTATNGSYMVRGLVTGSYHMRFMPGCGNRGSYLPLRLPNPVAVTTGKTTKGINAVMRPGGSIAGKVTDSHGNPLQGICVDASAGFQYGHGVTGADGTYRIGGLFAGSYTVQFSPGCGNNGPYGPLTLSAPVVVSLGKTTAGVDAVLQPDGMISGVVTGAASKPLAGICVVAMSQDSFGFAKTKTDGSYTLRRLGPGSYQVQFVPGGAFSNCGNNGNYLPSTLTATVSSGTTTTLNAVLPTGGVIAGVVRDSHGAPVPGVCVYTVGQDGSGNQVVSAKDGSYRLTQLFTTSYFVGFVGGCGNSRSVAPMAYRGDPTFYGPRSVPVTAGQVTSGIDQTLRPGGTITGKITDTAGQLLSNVCVLVIGETGAGSGGAYAALLVSHGGHYAIANLPPGQFLVAFSGLRVPGRGCGPSPYADQIFKGQGLPANPDLVSVPAGRVTSGVNATLPPAGKISGVITTRAGHPLPGMCVTVIDPRTNAGSSAFSERHGRYVVPDLPAGRYKVEFSNCGFSFFGPAPNYAPAWYKDKPTQATATPVIVTAGSTTAGIDAALVRGGAISGHVTYGPSGRPISYVCVLAYTPDQSVFSIALTDRRGDYQVTGLGTGRYLVEFDPCAYENALGGKVRGGRVSVTVGRTVRGVNEVLPAGGTVSGVTSVQTGATRPAPGTCVILLPENSTNVGSLAVAGPGGSYQATNLSPGRYHALFAFPGCSANSPSLSTQSSGQVQVSAEQTTAGVSAALRLAGGISGLVSGPGGKPLAGICVESVAVNGSGRVIGTTNAHGYLIEGLQPGRYKVEFTSGCGTTGYQTRWYKSARTRLGATVVTVRAATVTTSIDGRLPR
ncbi:MAG TPA: carboxypeptidase-like regulatory domain-containing protein [Streptosporangiaceae bacterium]